MYNENIPPMDGWMSDAELNWLYGQAQHYTSIVEVGSWCGKSTHALLSGCSGKVYAVDTWKGSTSQIANVHKRALTDDIFAEFMRNVGSFPNLYPMRMDSVDASTYFADGSVEMVFIDGDHDIRMVKRDLAAWRPKASCLLCGHDRNEGGVAQALHDMGISITNGPGTIWIADNAGLIPARPTGPNEVIEEAR